MRQRELFGFRLLFSFILATSLFVLIFFAAYSVSYLDYTTLSSRTNALDVSVARLDTILSHFECDTSLLVESSESFDQAATTLNLLEKRFGKHDARILEQKTRYSDLQYRHLLITERFNSECGTSFVPILFFYSNRDEAIQSESERVGFILTVSQRERVGRIFVYSFDVDLDSPIVALLKESHSITSAPVIVVNNSSPFYPVSLRQVLSYIPN